MVGRLPEGDRYDRLRAITAFGHSLDWEVLRTKHVVIAGVGGLGAVAVDLLTRFGIGRLTLFDMDAVDVVNLNRMGFQPGVVGRPKVEVMADVACVINPDVRVEACNGDIMYLDNEDRFEDRVSRADVVIMGVDNAQARAFVNQKCIKHRVPLVDGGTARSALSGFVQPVVPGRTACIACRGTLPAPLPREKGQRCTASLPTTMAIIAAIQVQEAIKLLVGLGKRVGYLTFNVITGEFMAYRTRRDPGCPACKHLRGDGDTGGNG